MRSWSIVAVLVLGGSLTSACGATRPDTNQETLEPAEAGTEAEAEEPGTVAGEQPTARSGPFVFEVPPGDARLEAFAAYIAGLRAEPAKPPAAPSPELAVELEALAAQIDKELARLEGQAEVSVHARHLASGTVLYDHEGARALNPASNHKLVTASAVLDLLGPDYRFETRVLRVGDRLYLIGEGDPSIDGERLRELAKAVAGRVELGGLAALVVDDSAFSPRLVGPGYDPAQGHGASFVAPSGALSLNFNTVEVVIEAGKDKRPKVQLLEASPHIVVDNKARVAKGAATVKVHSQIEQAKGVEGRLGGRTKLEVRGTLPAKERVKLRKRITDPGLYTGGAFARMLARAGHGPTLAVELGRAPAVELDVPENLEELELPLALAPLELTGGTETGEAPEALEVELVAVVRSEPLHVLVARLMAFSNNFMAENLLRTLAWRIGGEPGDWAQGAEVLARYWLALGNEAASLTVVNGSGLSEAGRVAPAALVELLAMSTRTQLPGQRLVDTLPIGGKSGTLSDRLAGTHQRVRAKTGTLDEVSGLSGLILDDEGEPAIAFSIVINNLEGVKLGAGTRHRVEDRIVEHLLEFSEPIAELSKG